MAIPELIPRRFTPEEYLAFSLMLAAGLSACGSPAPRTVQPPTLAVLPPAGHTPMLVNQPTVTPWPPTAQPDTLGYYPAPPVAPEQADVYWTQQETTDGGPAGDVIPTLQALLDRRDTEGLATMVSATGSDHIDFVGPIDFQPTCGSGSIPASAVAPMLQRLFDAGSRPIVQGYFAPFNLTDLNAPPNLFYIVTTGWRGALGLERVAVSPPDPQCPPMPATVTDTVVWSIRVDGPVRAWDRDTWMWADQGFYEPTVSALAWELEGGDSIPIPYHVVRPADP